MELTGKVLKAEKHTGTTQSGRDWVRYDILVNYIQGDFPKNAIMSFNGEKFSPVMDSLDKTISVHFDIDTRYVNDKAFTRCYGYKYKIED